LLQSGQLYIEFLFRVAVNQTLMHCVSLLLPNISVINSSIVLLGRPRLLSSLLKLSLKWIKHLRNNANRKLRFNPSIKAFSPSVLHANNPSSSEHSVVRKLPNLAYVFQTLCWCMRRGPMKTGGVFVLLLSNFRFRYVVTVKLMFSSNMLKVGSTPKMQKSFGLVQNRLRSSSCRLVARMTRKSGWTLHFLMKVASLDISSSRFAFSTRA
jgi:hypothetical protein